MILGADGKPVRSESLSDSPPPILDANGKVMNAPVTKEPEVAETVKPTRMAFKWAFDNDRARPLDNANTCPGCGRNAYFPKNSLICYDCAYRAQVTEKIGRNDPCPCGSEKKYKKCCGHFSHNERQSEASS